MYWTVLLLLLLGLQLASIPFTLDCPSGLIHRIIVDTAPLISTSLSVLTMSQRWSSLDVDGLLRQIRDSLHHYSTWVGSVKIVLASEEGEELHVVKIDAHCSSSSRAPPALRAPPPLPPVPNDTSAESSGLDGQHIDDDDVGPQPLRLQRQQQLIQQCEEQRRHIAALEARLLQAEEQLHQRHQPPDTEPFSADQLSPLSSASTSINNSGDSESPLLSNSGDTDGGGDKTHATSMALTDGADVEAQHRSDEACSTSPASSASSGPKRRSERSKAKVDRWNPSPRCDAHQGSARHSSARHSSARHGSAGSCSSRKKRETKRHHRVEHHDNDEGMGKASMEIDSVDDDGDAMEVAALVAKLREGYDKRQSVALDSLSKASILSLRQHVLEAEGSDGRTVSTQISALISTSSSLKMIGYYFRAILVHRLKQSSQSYQRLARDTLGIKSTADIAAYSALFDFIQHHYPTLAMFGIDAWLTNPAFLADITWTEWKRYLSKQGRSIIDAALQRFYAEIAPFQDWMLLEWVEVYDDDKMGGQGVRALRDIQLPTSKAKRAQRDVAASISVVAADLRCADPELICAKDTTVDIDPVYFLQLDQQRVFDARHHWIGKINHLPMPHCNLKLTGNGKLVQIKRIAAGDSLTFDYGIDYWLYQVTGLDASEWLSEGGTECQRGRADLFARMHDSVLDYSYLLREGWAGLLSSSSTAVEREGVLVELEECMDVMSHMHRRVRSGPSG